MLCGIIGHYEQTGTIYDDGDHRGPAGYEGHGVLDDLDKTPTDQPGMAQHDEIGNDEKPEPRQHAQKQRLRGSSPTDRMLIPTLVR